MYWIDKIRELEANNEPEKVLEEYLKLRPELLNDPLLVALFESKYFKSLADKTQVTQVFVVREAVATRLIHTLEVVAVAEYIAENLGLDVTNVRRIAFFHDVGHLPFGHIGERTIKNIINDINKSRPVFKKIIPEEHLHMFEKYDDLLDVRMSRDAFRDFLNANHNAITTEEIEIMARSLDINPEQSREIWIFANITPGELTFEHPDMKVMEHIVTVLRSREMIYNDIIPNEELVKLEKYDNFCHEQMSGEIFKRLVNDNRIELTPEVYDMILDGILMHGNGIFNAKTPEGKVVGISDKIAYITRDIVDSLKIGYELEYPTELGNDPDDIRDSIIEDVIAKSTPEEIKVSEETDANINNLKKYMYKNFYGSYDLKSIDEMFGIILSGVFLKWFIELWDIREDYEDEKMPQDVESMMNIDNSLLALVTKSDKETLDYEYIDKEIIVNGFINNIDFEVLHIKKVPDNKVKNKHGNCREYDLLSL